jgi:hypothetical protein
MPALEECGEPMARRRRIALLFHEADREFDLGIYLVTVFAEMWREAGHDVVFCFGTDDFVPADVAVLHVDLSVVPEAYLELAARYPVAVNGQVRDIRKSTLSAHRLRRGDDWDGPVIVKSDLNAAGDPERRRGVGPLPPRSAWRRALAVGLERTGRRLPRFSRSLDYRVFERLTDVPRACFDDPALLVEKFLPEREGGLHHVRLYHFLGDRWSCTRMAARHPIVCGKTHVSSEEVEPHPEIVALRHALGFDFGKLDYVVHDGKPVLLDANKTVASGNLARTPERLARWRRRAAGIEWFFGRAPGSGAG